MGDMGKLMEDLYIPHHLLFSEFRNIHPFIIQRSNNRRYETQNLYSHLWFELGFDFLKIL